MRGACSDVRNSYTCACPPGFDGDYCQRDVDECAQHACQHGATCRDHVARYSCDCAPGYSGALCEVDVDECQSAPCQHGAACRDLPGAFRCDCPPEWRGERCDVPRQRTCQHAPCAHNATCADVPDQHGNNYTCECAPGRVGVHCELAYCEVTPCVHGACEGEPPACACEPGYSGPLCDQERDECAGEAACLNGGRCVPRHRPPLCECPPGVCMLL